LPRYVLPRDIKRRQAIINIVQHKRTKFCLNFPEHRKQEIGWEFQSSVNLLVEAGFRNALERVDHQSIYYRFEVSARLLKHLKLLIG
jgi:hypothetical protein